jgi:hypothetical protein
MKISNFENAREVNRYITELENRLQGITKRKDSPLERAAIRWYKRMHKNKFVPVSGTVSYALYKACAEHRKAKR